MKWVLRILVGLLGVVLLWWASQMIASETGEVVVVTTTATDGSTHETRLWVVDHDGSAWLRAGGDGAGWYQQMLAVREIELERGEARARYTVQPDVTQRDVINTLMRDKYAWRDAYISFLFSRDDAVPIRLVPSPAGQDSPAGK